MGGIAQDYRLFINAVFCINIELIDHVIVANEKNYSFKSNALL